MDLNERSDMGPSMMKGRPGQRGRSLGGIRAGMGLVCGFLNIGYKREEDIETDQSRILYLDDLRVSSDLFHCLHQS